MITVAVIIEVEALIVCIRQRIKWIHKTVIQTRRIRVERFRKWASQHHHFISFILWGVHWKHTYTLNLKYRQSAGGTTLIRSGMAAIMCSARVSTLASESPVKRNKWHKLACYITICVSRHQWHLMWTNTTAGSKRLRANAPVYDLQKHFSRSSLDLMSGSYTRRLHL